MKSFALVAMLAFATSCGDRNVTAPGAAYQLTAPVSLDADITTIIDASFPKGLGSAAHARWDALKKQLVRTPKGPSQASKQQYLNLTAWIQSNTSALNPPNGETAAHAVARLVLDISLYVYNGPDYQPPIVAPTSDVTLSVVAPSTTTTNVVTPTQHAATSLPPGAISEPTVIVVAQEVTAFPANCSGPLHTRYCQYPQFYHFNVFPDVKLNVPARVAVCHVNGGSSRTPLPGSNHDQYRLAHDVPANPSDYTPGAVQRDGVEILPLVNVGDLMSCGTDTYSSILTSPTAPHGFFGKGRALLAAVARQVQGALTPQSAYAIDNGGGGETSLFSNFAVIDSLSNPDFYPAPGLTLSRTSTSPDSVVIVNAWTAQNAGTADGNYTTLVQLATDSLLTQNVIDVSPVVASATPLPPQQSGQAQPADTIHIPHVAAGTYYLGVRMASAGPSDDADPTNDVESVRIQISAPIGSVAVLTAPSPTSTDRVVFATQPTIEVRDVNNATVPGASITVSLTSGGGTLHGVTTAITNASGIASFTNLSIAGSTGPKVLTFASANNVNTTAPTNLTAGMPAHVAIAGGNNQSAQVATQLPTAASVAVTDADGNGVSGQTVSFRVLSGSGGVGTGSAVTDANGIAASTWTLGGQAGTQTLSATVTASSNAGIGFTGSTGGTGSFASISGNPVQFTAVGTPGAAARLVFVQAPISRAATALASSPMRVGIADAYGNVVPTANGTITVALASGPVGGTMSGTATQPTLNAVATFADVSFDKVGTYSVTASASGYSNITSAGFLVFVGPPANIVVFAGNNQTQHVNLFTPIQPQVRVTDAGGNPVTGVAITWAVASGGGSFTSFNPTFENSNGVAQIGWKMGPSPGTNTITATITTFSGVTGNPVTFTATAIP